jgi:hypothetical protein
MQEATAPDSPLQQALAILVPAVISLLGLAASWLMAVIRSKVKSEQARGMLLRLSEQASDVVLELEQGAVAKMREVARDGKLSMGDVRDLQEVALANLKSYIGSRGKADALKVLGFKDEKELEALLRSKIEAEVAKAKAAIGAKIKTALETAPKPAGVS